MRTRSIALYALSVLGLLAACGTLPPTSVTPEPTFTAGPPAATITPQPTISTATPTATATVTAAPLTVTPSPTPTATTASSGPSYGGCAYSWAYRDLPELSAYLQESFRNAGLADIAVSAYAFGEDCHLSSGEVTFGAMETDYRVNWMVTDPDSVAANLATVFDLILAVPPEMTQGPLSGRIEFTLVYPDHEDRRYVRLGAAYQARSSGLVGDDLVALLSETPQ